MSEYKRFDPKDDIRQAVIVGRYEILKFFSGKKIFIYLALVIAIFAILTTVYIMFGDDGSTVQDSTSTYFSFVTLFLLIGATLFSSVTLVSEFEERTALTLFTKPVHKSAIFLGKFVAAFLLNIAVIFVYSVLIIIFMAVSIGEFAPEIFVAFGYCTLYAFALTGIAILFSAVMKKSSSASIMTFIVLLFVPSIVALVLFAAEVIENATDAWYVLDVAANSMIDCFNGPVENGPRDALVMLMWGIIPAVASYFLFRRREV